MQLAGPLEIQGLGGNDLLRVFIGSATLAGGDGDGDDQYYLYDPGTVITELAGESTDLTRAAVDLVLAASFENGAALGASDVDLTGNALGNQLTGNAVVNALSGLAGNDRLRGRAGEDTLDGGLGNDILEGGADADRFVLRTGNGSDLIQDFETDTDVIDFTNAV
ncbi:MAG: hypothetical protein AAF479_14390 [Pseudomonadota bacterium]